MLKNLINKEVVVTYQLGYSHAKKKGVITKTDKDFILIDNYIVIKIDKIVKIVVKEKL